MSERKERFGKTPDVQDALVALLVAGQKRATTSLARWYGGDGMPWPLVGETWSVVDGRGKTCCRCRTTRVRTQPFGAVDAAFAAAEGEEDGSLERWQAIHREFFENEATTGGFGFDDTTLVVLVEFELFDTQRECDEPRQ